MAFKELDENDSLILIAKIIKDRMFALGWNQNEFATRAEVDPSRISVWLSGSHNFSVATLVRISNVIKMNLLFIKINE